VVIRNGIPFLIGKFRILKIDGAEAGVHEHWERLMALKAL